MAGYVSNRFDSNPSAKELAERINRLGPWLKDADGLDMQSVIDQKLEPFKTNIPQSEIEKYKRGIELLSRSNNYPQTKLDNFYRSLKYKRLVYMDGVWHFVNKLNTNWSDITDLLVDLFIRGGQLEKVLSVTDLKSFLLKNKKYLSKLLDKYFRDRNEYLDYTINAKIRTAEGDESEDVIEGFLIQNGFTIEYRGSNGDFIDMVFGADIIASHPVHGLKIIQVKKSGPYWQSLGRYNVDWVGIGNGVKIYDKNTKEDITDTLISGDVDEMVENFIRTGKI
jgi:hypothetical protein